MSRVLFLSSLWPPTVLGGAELYAARLAHELRSRGDDVAAVTLGVDGPDVVESIAPRPYRLDAFEDQPSSRRARYHAADLYRADAARGVRRAIERFRPDVVHSHAVQGLSASVLAEPSRARVAHVHTLHDYWLLCQRSTMVRRDGSRCEGRCRGCLAFRAARRVMARRGFPHVVVAPSTAIAREHARFPAVAARVRVVRHPVEPAPAAGRRAERRGRIGYLGRLTAIKGIGTLLEAFSSLEEASLVVAGEGPYADAVGRLGARAELLGWVDGAGRDAFFASIDGLVVPSEWKEPAPLVVNEAAARGVPVVGSDIGGIPELVPDVCRELLFRPGDAGDLAAKLRTLLADPSRFRFEPPTRSWDDHLAELALAYADASAAARAT